MALLPFAGTAMTLSDLNTLTAKFKNTEKMPVIFVGHGSPTNALEDNEFTRGWHNSIKYIPKPNAILCVSAHWETKGIFITAMEKPKTIHDFGGFSRELYRIEYPAPGSKKYADEIKNTITDNKAKLDFDWGLDHGCWVPVMKMFPKSDIPVLQLSLDFTKNANYHYNLGKELSSLRNKGVLIIGSGNMVHNLRMAKYSRIEDINKEMGFDWAYEMNDIFKNKIMAQDHKSLINYESLSKSAKLAIPTTEHYFPLLYVLAMQDKNEDAKLFNDKVIAGSLTMTSVKIG